jgi:hypothetical protein
MPVSPPHTTAHSHWSTAQSPSPCAPKPETWCTPRPPPPTPHPTHPPAHPHPNLRPGNYATCTFLPTSYNRFLTSGRADFFENADGTLNVSLKVFGLTNGAHGFTLNTYGDISDWNGNSTGTVFNGPCTGASCRPGGLPLGHLNNAVPATAVSNAVSLTYTESFVRLRGANSVVGRSIVLWGNGTTVGNNRVAHCVVGWGDLQAAPRKFCPACTACTVCTACTAYCGFATRGRVAERDVVVARVQCPRRQSGLLGSDRSRRPTCPAALSPLRFHVAFPCPLHSSAPPAPASVVHADSNRGGGLHCVRHRDVHSQRCQRCAGAPAVCLCADCVRPVGVCVVQVF